MTEASTTPDDLQTVSSPLAVGVQSYLTVLRSQLELTRQLTTAWASAVSAVSSSMLAVPSATAQRASGVGDQAAPGLWSTGFAGLRSVRDVGGADGAAPEPTGADFSWAGPALRRPAAGGMLRWLTEPPTLQTNLFDETIELLLDEDIKTAS